jgi:hypothetical protein
LANPAGAIGVGGANAATIDSNQGTAVVIDRAGVALRVPAADTIRRVAEAAFGVGVAK